MQYAGSATRASNQCNSFQTALKSAGGSEATEATDSEALQARFARFCIVYRASLRCIIGKDCCGHATQCCAQPLQTVVSKMLSNPDFSRYQCALKHNAENSIHSCIGIASKSLAATLRFRKSCSVLGRTKCSCYRFSKDGSILRMHGFRLSKE